MELQGFIDNFAAQFDQTDASLFTKDTIFKDLEEWDSLTALSVIAMVDDEYDKMISGAHIRAANTIEDLFNLAQAN